MKKMRCTSCGAELKIQDDKEYAVCDHCGTSYKLNEDVNINFKLDDNMKDVLKNGMEQSNKISKIMMIPFFIIFTLVICGFIFAFVNMGKSRDESNKRQNEIKEENEKAEQEAKEETERYSFNFQFTAAAGTKYGNQVESVLDDIIASNKNFDRKVTLVFNGESTIDETRIIEIKHGLGKWDEYEVVVNKDNDGYINEIKVDKIA